MPARVFWDEKNKAKLARLAARGWTARRIALDGRGFGHEVTPGAVQKAAARFGIPLLAKGGRPFGARKKKGRAR